MNSTKTYLWRKSLHKGEFRPTKNNSGEPIDLNIDPSVGIHIELYQCNEIDTIV